MTVDRDPKLDSVLTAPPKEAWQALFEQLWRIFSAPLAPENAEQEIAKRERRVSEIELLLSGSAWELWQDFENSVPRTAQSIIDFWNRTTEGKAVLILDALSLRESPWLLQEAKRRGYHIHDSGVRGSELPSDTTSFAKALGFGQRSAIENNGAGSAHRLSGARTESLDSAWDYCVGWIASGPGIVLWHHWPDDRTATANVTNVAVACGATTGPNEWTWVNGANYTDEPGTYGTQGTAAASNIPGARSGSTSRTDAAGNLWLFGGYGNSTGLIGYRSRRLGQWRLAELQVLLHPALPRAPKSATRCEQPHWRLCNARS
ncbi:MAG: hypothetical protein WA192_19675 [Candidatus Acidiferrales bacterium]